MEFIIKEKSAHKLVFELEGSTHSLLNVLKRELQEDTDVVVATYSISHPLVGVPTFFLETTAKKSPEAALQDAIKKVKAKNKDFLTKAQKVM
ncbi:MAG: DNA-directed RNA polymerase subunit L [Candidatus Woesearchaeota archaeon]|nr:MAG: DNA-directed RNA polymerase subunit L [Candidatus Woesearchaeota archaeon]